MFEGTNNMRRLLVTAAIVLVMISGASVAYQVSHSEQSIAVPGEEKANFTVDEGKTLFVDSASKIPPFDHDGKPAVRAYVFTSGGKQFVGYLERFTPAAMEAKKKLVDQTRKGPPDNSMVRTSMAGREVKKPGDEKWFSTTDYKKVVEFTTIKGPDGSPAELVTP